MTTARFNTPQSRLVAIWILRIFSDNCARHVFIDGDKYKDAEIAHYLGLPTYPGKDQVAGIYAQMDAMLAELEEQGDAAMDEPAASNLRQLAETFYLNETEKSIVTFLSLVRIEPALKAATLVIDRIMLFKPALVLFRALRLECAEVESAIDVGGRLLTSGILKNGRCHTDQGNAIRFYSAQSARKLTHSECDHSGIINAIGLTKTDAPELTLADYQHLDPQLTMLVDYLRAALDSNRPGVNILLHGRPGTGKTQLTRVIAREVGSPVYDFSLQDDDGDAKDSETRFSSIRVAGSFFRNKHALLVFDELEDILGSANNDKSMIGEHKGLFNRMLETNPTPIFWLTNSTNDLDAAFCRRFDFVLEVTVPPRSRRESILRQHGGRHLSETTIKRLAELDSLSPAVVTRVSGIFDAVTKPMTQDKRDETFARMVGSVMKVQGHGMPAINSIEILPVDVYSTACLNTNADLPGIARMLHTHPHGRICLHGPPGTGKTAFGHWLAREIDRPLHVKRASDLLSPYVGGTEMKIAQTFEKALDDDAILLIDEVDSFLQDRAKAVRSWEVTQVNELLIRIESFTGVFIATTNRLEHLDSASLRRFDMKLRFDFINPRQIHDLLCAWCRSLGISPPSDEHQNMIGSMEYVTPGDFAAAARRHRFQPFADAYEFLRTLMDESSLKSDSKRQIGFH